MADGRASAISTASWNLFSNIGLVQALEPLGCPIAAIAVTDAQKPGRIDFRPEPHEGSLGRMFANRDIRLDLDPRTGEIANLCRVKDGTNGVELVERGLVLERVDTDGTIDAGELVKLECRRYSSHTIRRCPRGKSGGT